MGHTLIFVGGDAPPTVVAGLLPAPTRVIAADSGWAHAISFGMVPDELVGDLDSISAAHLAHAREVGATITEYPAEKDHTDSELAVRRAVELGDEHITIVSGGGDRFDHLLAMIHSLAGVDAPVTALVGSARIDFARSGADVVVGTRVGATVSLIPIAGDAVGVVTRGLKWNLTTDTLVAAASRGVSNVATERCVRVSVSRGTVAVIIPNFANEGEQ